MNDANDTSRDWIPELLEELDELVIEPNEDFCELDLEDRFNFDRGGFGGAAYC